MNVTKRGTDTKTNSDTTPSQSLYLIELAFDKSEHVKKPPSHAPPPGRVCFKMKFSFSFAHCNFAFCFYLESHSKEAFVS